MKTQSQTLFNQISKAQGENLTTVVDETLAKGYTNCQQKTFSSIDMWNIQRQRKTTVIR